MNKVNLQKMADHIKTIPQELFDMQKYRDYDFDDVECGSIGCVIGHCVQLDPEPEKIHRKTDNTINFRKWSANFSGLDNTEWDWCFAGLWANIDNTPIGASKRIEYLINHGLPTTFLDQMYGKAKLCYNLEVGKTRVEDELNECCSKLHEINSSIITENVHINQILKDKIYLKMMRILINHKDIVLKQIHNSCRNIRTVEQTGVIFEENDVILMQNATEIVILCYSNLNEIDSKNFKYKRLTTMFERKLFNANGCKTLIL